MLKGSVLFPLTLLLRSVVPSTQNLIQDIVEGSISAIEPVFYTMKLTSAWSNVSNPFPDYPPGAFFIAPVLASHNSSYQMWSEGKTSTVALKVYAESGSYEELDSELEVAFLDEDVIGDFFIGDDQPINSVEGEREQILNLVLDGNYPLISFLAKISPSPDFFIGFHDIMPISENYTWYDSFRLTLYAYDAGTDSGTTFDAQDDPTDSQDLISRLDASSVFGRDGEVVPVAYATFQRLLDDVYGDMEDEDAEDDVAFGGDEFSDGFMEDIQRGEVEVSTPVEYEMTFFNNWSPASHPNDFPEDAHWTSIVAASHSNEYQMWAEGIEASPGVQQVAEHGNSADLARELDDANDSVGSYLVGNQQFDLDTDEGEITPKVSVDRSYSGLSMDESHQYVSFVAKMAPSPDWFGGFNSVKPVGDNGKWYDAFTIAIYPYDAGTDSGSTYKAEDDPTNPQEGIFALTPTTVPESSNVFVDDGEIMPVAFVYFERVGLRRGRKRKMMRKN